MRSGRLCSRGGWTTTPLETVFFRQPQLTSTKKSIWITKHLTIFFLMSFCEFLAVHCWPIAISAIATCKRSIHGSQIFLTRWIILFKNKKFISSFIWADRRFIFWCGFGSLFHFFRCFTLMRIRIFLPDANWDLDPAPHQSYVHQRPLESKPFRAPVWASASPFWASTTLHDSILSLYSSWIFDFHSDPDTAFIFDADPDPASQNVVHQEPQQTFWRGFEEVFWKFWKVLLT